MTISVLPLKPYDRQQVNAFLSFSFRIYREYPLWVPPLEFGAKFSRQANIPSIAMRNQPSFSPAIRKGILSAALPKHQ